MDSTAIPKSLAPTELKPDSTGGLSIVDKRALPRHLQQYLALQDFIDKARVPTTTSHFRSQHTEEFVRYLRTIQVAPNGHPNSKKRPLLDKGVKFILEIREKRRCNF